MIEAAKAKHTGQRISYLDDALRYTNESRQAVDDLRKTPGQHSHLVTHIVLNTLRVQVDLRRRIVNAGHGDTGRLSDLDDIALAILELMGTARIMPDADGWRDYDQFALNVLGGIKVIAPPRHWKDEWRKQSKLERLASLCERVDALPGN
jgi:hypothetical protein